MLPDRVSNPGPLTYESGALSIALRGPAWLEGTVKTIPLNSILEFSIISDFKGSSQHQVGGEWFEIELGKISRMLVKYEVLPIPNVISVC